MAETTVTIEGETWRLLHQLYKELGVSKKRLVHLAVAHLAGCEEAKSALATLGYDVDALTRTVSRSSRNWELSVVTS